MSFLVDTSTLSQTIKALPDPAVMRWWNQRVSDELAISSIVIQELRYGIERMPQGGRRNLLERWLTTDVVTTFSSRILSVDTSIADRSGRLLARARAAGHNPDVPDVLIAATAEVHNLTIATLNYKHFIPFGSKLVVF